MSSSRTFSLGERRMLELALALNGHGQIVVCARFRSEPVSASQCLAAAAAVVARHPLLRSSVGASHEGTRVAEPCPPLPVSVAAPGADALQLATAELESPLPLAGGLLWRLVYLPPILGEAGPPRAASSSSLVLSLSHCIADGISGIALVGELVEALLRPRTLPPPATTDWEAAPYEGRMATPPSAAALAAKDAAEGAQLAAGRHWPPAVGAGLHAACGLAVAELLPAEAAGLLAACRAQRTTVNGALVAAVAAAARHERGEPAAALCVSVCVDCRPFCRPPPAAGELGCMFEPSVTLLQPAGEFWDTARSARAQVGAFISRGVFGALCYAEAEVVGAAQGARALVERRLPSPFSLYTSNVGVQSAPPEVEAVWFATQQRTGICGYVAHAATTSAGRLCLASSFARPDWAGMHERVVATLRERSRG